MRRGDALDERRARTQQHLHLAGHARLRGHEQGLDVAAHGIEMLSLVHQIAVGLRDGFLDARLLAGQHQLLELAVRGEQHVRRRGLEGDASLGADDGVAQMDAAPDAVGTRELSSCSMSATGGSGSPSRLAGTPATKPTMCRSGARG